MDIAAKLPLLRHRANYQYIVKAKLTLGFRKNNIGPLVMYDLIPSGWH